MAEQQDERPVPPEGRSRGPNIHSGGTQDMGAPLPPYEGRSTTGEDIEKRGSTDHDAGSREISQEEREGMRPDDTTPAGPLGVGETRSSQGNEQMVGESEETHRKDRTEVSAAGVGRSKPIDPESPDMPTGDQGG